MAKDKTMTLKNVERGPSDFQKYTMHPKYDYSCDLCDKYLKDNKEYMKHFNETHLVKEKETNHGK